MPDLCIVDDTDEQLPESIAWCGRVVRAGEAVTPPQDAYAHVGARHRVCSTCLTVLDLLQDGAPPSHVTYVMRMPWGARVCSHDHESPKAARTCKRGRNKHKAKLSVQCGGGWVFA